MSFYVYLMTNKPYGTLYIGQTDDLWPRVSQHKNEVVKGFTEKYKLDRLVYYEVCNTREQAKQREANIKAWKRDWKINLIESLNPKWDDLAFHLNSPSLLSAEWTPAYAGETAGV